MHIGVIAHLKHSIAEPFAGGLEMHTHLMCRALRDRGHEVTLFASTRSDPTLGLEAICPETALLSVGTTEAHDVAFFREHHAYLALMNRLRRSDFDVVQNNSLHYLPAAMADALPMPLVTTLHTPPFCWLESGVRECRSPHAHFVGVSEDLGRRWRSVRPLDRIIPNGIELTRFGFQPEPTGQAHLIWFGRVVPEKGLHLALDAARIAGLPLRFAGPLLDADYHDREIRPRLGPDVTYLGHLDHAALSVAIGQASAFLCTPCWDEPYGLVVAESLACGTPVAAFARGAIPEIVTPDTGVLAAPGDAVDLARAALTAVSLSRAACRARAQAACDAEAMLDAYLELYADAIAAMREPAVLPDGERLIA
ncbi:glycosyltransferase [Brevundimonas lutea]|uniref:glycosyltransferase n=1 Tax=Brevundimonas lutea TaxID=2293980 RepID=UPI000F015863|nr:glycosyltransferase [Brevundimonas lutea]